MEFSSVVRERRAVQEFTEGEVPVEKIEDALEVARNAPSAWNLQPWKVFVLESEEAFDEAVESSYDQEWMRGADRILLIAGDLDFEVEDEFMEDMVEKGYSTGQEVEETREYLEEWSEREFEWKELELTSNCMFLASALMHALWGLGVGSCPVKGFDQRGLHESLELERWYPVLLMPVGISADSRPKKERKSVPTLLERI